MRVITPPPPPPVSPYAAHSFKKHPPHNVLPSLQENQVHKGQSTPNFSRRRPHLATRSSAHTRAPFTATVCLPFAWSNVADSGSKEALAVFMLRLTDEYKDAGKFPWPQAANIFFFRLSIAKVLQTWFVAVIPPSVRGFTKIVGLC